MRRLIAALAAAHLGAMAHAGEPAPKIELIRTVSLFRVLCLSQLPDLDRVATAAGLGEFGPATNEELDKYRADTPAKDLRAWSFHDASGEYVLTAATASPDAALKKDRPKLAKATGAGCSLHIPPGERAETVLASLVALLGRAPDKTWQEGETQVSAWNKETGRNFSQVRFYAPAKPGLNGVLRATIFVQN